MVYLVTTKLVCIILSFMLMTGWCDSKNQSSFSNDNSHKFLSVDEAFVFTTHAKSNNLIEINIAIQPGYYLYESSINISGTESVVLLKNPILPDSIKKFDTTLKQKVNVFIDSFTVSASVRITKTPAYLNISFQGCSENGLCYPPQQLTLNINTPDFLYPTKNTTTENFNDENYYRDLLEKSNILMILILFLLAGIGLSFTPCSLPMIPIVSNIIIGKHNQKNRRVPFLATSYVFSMSITLAILGALTGLFGASLNLQMYAQSPFIIIPTSILFAILSLSSFGIYTLQLPGFIRNKLGIYKNSSGSISKAILLGIISALVVSPCITAPLAGALIYIATNGNPLSGGLALFSLGLGMGTPYICIALGGRSLLPKAGLWIHYVNSLFGSLLLALAIWTLGKVIPPPITLALWGLLAIGNGIFLGALNIPSKKTTPIAQQTLGLFLLIYGICAVIGVASNNSDPLAPLANKKIPYPSQKNNTTFTDKYRISTASQLNQLLKQAHSDKMPVVINFTADWCQNCHIIDQEVLQHPIIRKKLDSFLVVHLDITKNTHEQQSLLNKYNLFGPPAFLFFNKNGLEQTDSRLQGDITVSRLIIALDKTLLQK